ncbi:MAG: tetratricopeptide repeat protein, partial [Albidovulum sp.]|uniref:tetratricopeptide repeat protein n=1 Tax=Albidovulum sp. TaxID=1872424 RepID=UPI003C9E1414
LKAIRIAADYGRAIDGDDVSGLLKAAAEAQDLRASLPDNMLLRRVAIDDHMRAQDYQDALRELDAALVLLPDDRSLRAQRLTVLAAQGDDAGVEASLLDMVDRFSDAPEMQTTLVRWYAARKEFDKAETFLRQRVSSDTPDQTEVLNLVRFLAEQRGADVAVAELDRVISTGQDAPAYRSTRASFIFNLGRRDDAIAEMRDLLKNAPASEETRHNKIGLAQMLSITGNTTEANALVEDVLSEDPGDTEALKLKAGWLILDDSVGEAISILRRAIDQSPRDAQILTLMAQAYERDGNRELMRESLSRATAASNRAPAESLRYAQLLANEDKLIPAEAVLIDALRIAPGNTRLLMALGEIYIRVQDWPRAASVASALEGLDDTSAQSAAQTIRTAVISGQDNTDQAVRYLQGLVDQGDAGLAAKIAILRTHLDTGDTEKARSYSQSLLATDPENPDLRFIDASVRNLTGDAEGAETVLRDLVEQSPRLLPGWMALLRIVAADESRLAEAETLLDTALESFPDSDDLKWAKAGLLEKSGNIEGAIAIYEAMYKANSANPVIANNLASLLSNHRSDPDSIARAEVIARRLRDSTVAPFQDTYGWIAHLRGNQDEAIRNLEKAAATLTDDPVVQYHLAEAYLAQDRRTDALERFHKALSLLKADDERDFAVKARQETERLEAEGVTVGN